MKQKHPPRKAIGFPHIRRQSREKKNAVPNLGSGYLCGKTLDVDNAHRDSAPFTFARSTNP